MRLRNHLAPSRLVDKTHKNYWLISIEANPIIHSIQTLYTKEDLAAAEIYWIKFFRDQGCDLTNGTDGGDGVTMTSEVRAKISAAHTGKVGYSHTSETKNLMSIAAKGKKKSPEHRAKIGAAQKGKKKSPEQIAKMSANAKAQQQRRNLLGRFESQGE